MINPILTLVLRNRVLRVQSDVDPVMTSTVAESPARYEGSNPQAVTTPSRPVSPMNTIGEGATPLMYACQQSRDQDVRNILAKNVSVIQTARYKRLVCYRV